jgi:hypothetical protein
VTYGGVTDDEAFRTLDLFAQHIMPAFAPARAAAPTRDPR